METKWEVGEVWGGGLLVNAPAMMMTALASTVDLASIHALPGRSDALVLYTSKYAAFVFPAQPTF